MSKRFLSSAENDAVLTVDDLTNKIRETLISIPAFQNVTLRGEMLGFKMHSSGHAYFAVLGKESRISCVLFRSQAASVITWPKDGDEILVRGRLDVYGARGAYQIYAAALLPIGAGAKARAKEVLQAQLTKEGLFDPRHKRPIPFFPEKIAVITSLTGAALQDVIKISRQRCPAASLLVIPSLMQGVSAPQEIAEAFSKCSSKKELSLVLLVRGGGSRDDLDPFDSEMVVRAVRSCPVPVVTGLGHQIDTTLADMAADLYAPTPSGAAERVFPDRRELLSSLQEIKRTMTAYLLARIDKETTYTRVAGKRLCFGIYKGILEPAFNMIDNMASSVTQNINFRISQAESSLKSMAGALQISSPLSILSKGYAICKTKDGQIIRSVKEMTKNDKIKLQMRDGVAAAVVASTELLTPQEDY